MSLTVVDKLLIDVLLASMDVDSEMRPLLMVLDNAEKRLLVSLCRAAIAAVLSEAMM